MEGNVVIQRIITVMNLLNEIEVKGFYNIKNLGAAIQQLDNLVGQINQKQRSVNENQQPEGN